MRIVAGTAIVSGVLVLLGWFTLPVRAVLLLALAIIIIFVRRARTPTVLPLFQRGSERGWAMHIIPVAAGAIAAILILWNSGTTDPIRSPWTVVPVPFFFLYALVAVFSARGGCASGASISITLVLASLVALLVYPLGFGFDHFIHAAAERIIATTGSLSPPPLFYSGHYGLTVLLADLLPGVGVDLADRILAPLLVAILLIPLAYRSLCSVLPDRAARLGVSSLLIVPFLPLAVSTPQATANVFAVAVVFALLATDFKTAALVAAASAFAQPMTGIIAIAVVAMAFVWQRGWWIVATTIAALGAAGIPLAFALAARIVPNLDLRVAFDPLPAVQRLGYALADAVHITAADFATADALEVARIILPLLWVGLAIVGAVRVPTGQPEEHHSHIRANVRMGRYALIAAPLTAIFAAMVVAATVTVPTQLAEEQTQFPLRLLQLAALLATPLAAVGLGTLLDRIRGRLPQTAAAIAMGAAATFTLLLAYPRDDAQARSGLWSVSASDIAAVHTIAEDAGNTPYVVLANQMLGAAAIRELGFRPAHRLSDGSEILAFPLPAGGPVARKYWDFVSQDTLCLSSSFRGGAGGGACPGRQPINAAMSLANVPRAYVVLHDYWRNYDRLAAATAAIANAEVGTFRHLRIFRFDPSG